MVHAMNMYHLWCVCVCVCVCVSITQLYDV